MFLKWLYLIVGVAMIFAGSKALWLPDPYRRTEPLISIFEILSGVGILISTRTRLPKE